MQLNRFIERITFVNRQGLIPSIIYILIFIAVIFFSDSILLYVFKS